ncbi:thioredoxin-dependent thiol peroxidase [Myxococcota bacterium]|nr:thioredoxin-dependent thiol peroxidase [Myxococcota bacterium]
MATKKKTTTTEAAAPAAKKAAKKATKKKAAKKATKKAAKAKAPKAAKAKPAKAAKAAKPAKAAKKAAKKAPKKAAKAKAPRAKKAKAEAAPAAESAAEGEQPDGSKSKSHPAVRPAPEVGSRAPEFTLQADDGSEVSLASLEGKNVVLYFYPKDSTPGCTIEACGFRDAYAEIEAKGAVVLGVSRDSLGSHAKFKAAQKLPFPLLSDPSGEMIASYGSYGEKTFMGRKSMGILRTTVLIDRTGKIAKIYPKVSVKEHAAQVLADLATLPA